MAEGYSSNYDVKESSKAAKFIAKRAQNVYINIEGVKDIVCHVTQFWRDNIENYAMYNKFKIPPTYPRKDEKAIDWLFVLHTLNFSLWNRKSTKQWTVFGAKGFGGLCNAINRAINEGKDICDPKYYTNITQSELEHILRGDDTETGIPLIQERFRILREVGQVLLNKYKGTFLQCILSAQCDTYKLINLLFDEFESYGDETIFEGSMVRFHNKAESLIIDIWVYSKDMFKFNLDNKKILSMFFNYRTPQVLFHFKAICYSDVLMTRFQNNNEPLLHGSREELEIRSCSLVVTEKVCEIVQKRIEHMMKEIPVLQTKKFHVMFLINNYIFGVFAHFHDECNMEDKEPLHYIRTLHY